MTSVIALVMAVPLAFGIAFFLTELAPNWMRRPVGTAVELLAAVPSIIYGMWGFFVIVPFMGNTSSRSCPTRSAISRRHRRSLHGGPPFGTGILTAALILAVMIIPFIAATMRDVFLTVPPVYKESRLRRRLHDLGGDALHRAFPTRARPSSAASCSGSGRALGETMAVTFVIGNTNRIATSLFAAGNTIASLVALEFPESAAGQPEAVVAARARVSCCSSSPSSSCPSRGCC